MTMIAIRAELPRTAVARMTFSANTPARRAPRSDTLRLTVAAALAQESSLRLAESIRTYASQSRANGDSIHEVLDVLMKLACETTPQNVSSAKRSSDVAEWAIAGYFEERESMRTAIWRATGRREGTRVRRQ